MLAQAWRQAPAPKNMGAGKPVGTPCQPGTDASYSKHMKHLHQIPVVVRGKVLIVIDLVDGFGDGIVRSKAVKTVRAGTDMSQIFRQKIRRKCPRKVLVTQFLSTSAIHGCSFRKMSCIFRVAVLE